MLQKPTQTEIGMVNDKLRFTLLKDNSLGNRRKWHIPHSSCI